MSIDTYSTLHEARQAHVIDGGILLVNDDGTWSICRKCDYKRCECRTIKWIKTLAPSWDESAPENAARDPRHIPQQQSLL